MNAQSGCNDCHTWPNYTSDPFLGEQKQVNTVNYLAGGRPFGPFLKSANITPDKTSGLPANLTWSKFLAVMRHGTDPDDPSKLLQVMPWPVFQDMSQHDLEAIYAYLSAIPHAEPAP